jgi:hypothetical protein
VDPKLVENALLYLSEIALGQQLVGPNREVPNTFACCVGENYIALAKQYPAAPASKGLVNFGGYLMLDEEAFLNDFANGVDPTKARPLFSVQQPNVATLSATAKTTVPAWRLKPIWSASWQNE